MNKIINILTIILCVILFAILLIPTPVTVGYANKYREVSLNELEETTNKTVLRVEGIVSELNDEYFTLENSPVRFTYYQGKSSAFKKGSKVIVYVDPEIENVTEEEGYDEDGKWSEKEVYSEARVVSEW